MGTARQRVSLQVSRSRWKVVLDRDTLFYRRKTMPCMSNSGDATPSISTDPRGQLRVPLEPRSSDATDEHARHSERASRNRLHYVFVGTSPVARASGATIAFGLAVRGVRERGIRVSEVDYGGVGAARRPGEFSGLRALRTLRPLLRAGARLLRTNGLYLVMSRSRAGFVRDAIAIWIAVILRRATVLHLHGGGYDTFYEGQPRWMRYLIRVTLSKVDAIIVLGHLLTEQFSFLPRKRLVVIPNGLPMELEPPKGTPRHISYPIRILYLSNLIESKGYLELVRACALLRDAGLDLTCDLCGAFIRTAQCSPGTVADARVTFSELVDDLGLQDIIRYRGVVTGPSKQEILEQASLLVLPTSYPGEGQPLSIIEALAFGVPVIATRFRGIPEQVVDGVNGHVITSARPEAIAAAVWKALRDDRHYADLSVGARRHYLEHFRQDVHIDKVTALLEAAATVRIARADVS